MRETGRWLVKSNPKPICRAHIPEKSWGFMAERNRVCQRPEGHAPPHRSRGREWNDGDRESKTRF